MARGEPQPPTPTTGASDSDPGQAAGARVRRPAVHQLDRFELESGTVLYDVRQVYFLDGELSAERDNLVVVVHALTGSADAMGDWWRDVVGPGLSIDTERYAVLCSNLLGSCYGTTGPADPTRRPFPPVTTRDMARLIAELVQSLEVASVALVVGGSLGGMVALELAATFPTLARRALILAAPAEHSASAIAWNHIQRRAITVGGEDGLEVARMIAMMTYRTPGEFATRFGRDRHPAGGYAVEQYLTKHGHRLRARFDVHSYLALLDAMDSHDVGRGRGGVEAALRRFEGSLVGVGIPGDILYPDHEVRYWTDISGADYREIHSVHGHDAFLIESGQVTDILREMLGEGAVAGQAAGGDERTVGGR